MSTIKSEEAAVLCEIGQEPRAGRLTRVNVAMFHRDLPVPLTFATLQEACSAARARGWTLVPLPDRDEEYRPETCRDLSDEAWVTVRRLMS